MGARARRILVAYGLFAAGMLAIAMAMAFIAVASWRIVPLPVAIAAIAALTPCIYLVARPYWKRIDELQRHMQATSWFWGGVCGLMFGLTSAIAIGGPPSGHRYTEFVKGALFMVMAQSLGYFIAVLIRWQANRPRGG